VVVVPDCSDHAAPMPDTGFLEAVQRYLDRRRTVATELHVIAPRYQRVTVRARLHLGAAAGTTTAAAVAALHRFLHPLHGGPDGGGWPIGRPVYRSEVLALLAALPGVGHVDQLELFAGAEAEPRCGNVSLCPDGLVESGDHEIEMISRSTAR
jgi:predicted phage baseplate assembly protein